jgi:hypothetical protein
VSRADSPAGPAFDERSRDDEEEEEGSGDGSPGGGGRGGRGRGGGGEREAGVGEDGYDSNAREYADDLDYNDDDYDDVVDDVDVDYEDDGKAQAQAGDEVEEEVDGGGALLGIISYVWMLVALALFAYLIMKVQDQAGTIKVLQRRVASLETRLGLQPMMPMEMQNQKM